MQSSVILMRFALCLGLIPAVSTPDSIRKQPTYQSTIVSQTKVELTNFLSSQSPFTIGYRFATKVWVRLPDLEQTLNSAFASADGSLNLNIILMSHASMDGKGQTQAGPATLASQNRIREILEATKPEIIGFEGDYGQPVSFLGLAQHIAETNLEFGRLLAPETAQKMITKWISHDGALQYLQDHPTAQLVGTEDQALYSLTMLLQQFDSNNALLPRLYRLRNELGLAKTILELKKRGLTNGVVIPGRLDGPDYKEVLSQLPVKAKFTNTVITPVTTANLR